MKNIRKIKLLYLCIFIMGGFMLGCQEEEDAGPAPMAAFSISATSELKQGSVIEFMNESEGFSFLWSFGDGQISQQKSPIHTYDTPGSYQVTLEVNANGERSVISQQIDIAEVRLELYFIDNNDLKVKKLNVSDTSLISDVFNLGGFSFGLAYDATSDELYYSDDDELKVFKNSISGGNEVEIASDLQGPRAIALDLENDRIFVADRSGDQVVQVNVTDGTVSPLFGSEDDGGYLLPVGLDLYDGVLYSTTVDFDAEGFWTASVTGDNLKKIIDYSTGGFGYGIEVDEVNKRIYFDDNDTGTLLSANLDGSDIQEIGTSSDQVYGIVVNNALNKVYWASRNGVIKEANLDGTGERILKTTGADIRGLIIREIK